MSSISIKILKSTNFFVCVIPIVTCDYRWFLYDNCKRSGQWLDREESPKTTQNQKVMVTVWWSSISVIHYSFLETKHSITAEIYSNKLADMHASLQKKRPAKISQTLDTRFYHSLHILQAFRLLIINF